MPTATTVPTSYRDLSKLTDAAGKFTVPTVFYNQLVEHMIEVSGILQAGPTVLNTAGGEVIQIPKTLTHTSNPAIVAEAGPLVEADPTFGQTSLGAFKYARMVQMSRELLQDTGVDLTGYLARSVGRAIGNAFGEDLIIGAGTTEPRGIQLDAGAGVTGPTGTTVTFGNQATVGQGFDLLISLFHSRDLAVPAERVGGVPHERHHRQPRPPDQVDRRPVRLAAVPHRRRPRHHPRQARLHRPLRRVTRR